MPRITAAVAVALALTAVAAGAQQPQPAPAPTPPFSETPYKVVQRARVGGEGGTDYIFADVAGRKLYIPRGAVRADTVNGRPASPARITIFDLDNLKPLGEILTAPNSQGNGATVDPKTGHGFSSSRPGLTMFDAKTMQVMKSIPLDSGFAPDGIFFDAFSNRVYVGSHPTKDAMVVDPNDGTVTAKIDLGGIPEQNASDGKGTVYFVLQDPSGSVVGVDTKTMKITKRFPLGDHGRCNGLAMDVKNQVLFAACALGTAPAGQSVPAAPAMVILSAVDGKILAELPLAGASDGAAFNPQTMEAFSTHGNGTITVVKEKSPTSFEVEQNLETMNGARTIAFDSKTGRIFAMSVERGPAPPPPAGGGRGGAAPIIPGSFTIVVVAKP